MYKIASDKAQRRVGHIALKHLARGEELTSDEEKLRSIKAAITALNAQFASGSIPASERRAASERQHSLQAESTALKAKILGERQSNPTPAQAFVDAAKELLPAWQFKSLMDAARKRAG